MYNIKPYSYIPEPQPAKSDRIIAAHYYAAWKKGAAGLHDAFNDLAQEFPDRTPLMGYYDEENPEVCDWEIKWALEHGINCFIYCWYRRRDNMGKPVTENDLRCGHGLHEALFHAKFQDKMKFAIMFEASPRWGGTDKDDLLKNLMPFWCETYFKRGNYLILDNKPVLFVYQQDRLGRECFASAEEQRAAFDACREYAKTQGFDGMIFAREDSGLNRARHEDCLARGYDFHFGYGSGYSGPNGAENDFTVSQQELIDGQADKLAQNLGYDPMTHIPTVTCFHDATPRFSKKWNDQGYAFRKWGSIWYLKPENYRLLLRRMREMTDALPDGAWGKRIFMIDNWNEWDEGHFVSPSVEFGFSYLQAIREELTERNNLPDYRMPGDLGFGGYNTAWKTPDFGAFCKAKLDAGEPVFPVDKMK